MGLSRLSGLETTFSVRVGIDSMSRYGDLNYQWWAKTCFLVSLAVFALGAGGEITAAAMHLSLPRWENVLFTDMEILGTLGALFSPLVFGILLPLTE